METSKNQIDRFINEKCYKTIWDAVSNDVKDSSYFLEIIDHEFIFSDTSTLTSMSLKGTKNIRVKEDTLMFDAVVDCEIHLNKDGYHGTACLDFDRQLLVSCEAIVKEKLESIRVTNIAYYIHGAEQANEGYPVSKSIVPIISKKDMDAEAEEFLKLYCPEALEKPMCIPIKQIAEAMQLKVIQGIHITDDFSIFGEICFSAGEVEVYDLYKSAELKIAVERGTILVDADTFYERNEGCVNNTIAHEVYHWYKHRMYAAVKHVLNSESLIACRCPSSINYPDNDTEWTDGQWMEWQANNMAPRILMPITTFKMKVDELCDKYNYALSPSRQAAKYIVWEIADFYSVSKQSALIRMKDAGYDVADGIYQYDKSSLYHSRLDRRDAFYAYRTDSRFRELVDSGLFRYVEGFFAINDDKYIKWSDDGECILTACALENLSECTLQFTWQDLSKAEGDKYFPFEVMRRNNGKTKVSNYDPQESANAVLNARTLQDKRNEFESQKAARKLTTVSKTCWELIFDIITSHKIGVGEFCNLTDLGEEVYRRAKDNRDTKPSKRTIVAIAVGFSLDLSTAEKLLQLAGHAFSESDEDQALKFCITGFSGRSMAEANMFLESYGYKPLGSKQRR